MADLTGLNNAPTPTAAGPVHQCARCGYDMDKPQPTLAEADQKEFVRRLLAGEPFSKKYQLYGGKLTFVFTSLTMAEARQLDALLPRRSPELTAEQLGDLSMQGLRAKLVCYLTEFNGKPVVPFLKRPDTKVTAEEYFDELHGAKSEDLVGLALSTLTQYLQLTSWLQGAGFDKNFHMGAGYV